MASKRLPWQNIILINGQKFHSNPLILLIYGCTIHCRHYFCFTAHINFTIQNDRPNSLKSCFYHNLRISAGIWVIFLENPSHCVKGVVNCQNKRDNVVPRIQKWPLDIPQWHITPHPQLSAKIIRLYAFHTHRRIKSKFPIHSQGCVTVGVCKQLTSSILTVRAFPVNTSHSPNVGLMSANVADVGLTLKQHWANFSLK